MLMENIGKECMKFSVPSRGSTIHVLPLLGSVVVPSSQSSPSSGNSSERMRLISASQALSVSVTKSLNSFGCISLFRSSPNFLRVIAPATWAALVAVMISGDGCGMAGGERIRLKGPELLQVGNIVFRRNFRGRMGVFGWRELSAFVLCCIGCYSVFSDKT